MMFDVRISSRNLNNFLNGKKYIVTYESLTKYCNSFMHMQQTLGTSDVKWRIKKIDRKECAIFLRRVGEDDSDKDEDDVSQK